MARKAWASILPNLPTCQASEVHNKTRYFCFERLFLEELNMYCNVIEA